VRRFPELFKTSDSQWGSNFDHLTVNYPGSYHSACVKGTSLALCSTYSLVFPCLLQPAAVFLSQ